MPTHEFSCGTLRTWRGAQAAVPVQQRETLVGTFADRRKGEAAFQALTTKLPAQASAELFGQSLLVTLPADEKLEKKWRGGTLSKVSGHVQQQIKIAGRRTLISTAPSEEAAIGFNAKQAFTSFSRERPS